MVVIQVTADSKRQVEEISVEREEEDISNGKKKREGRLQREREIVEKRKKQLKYGRFL